MNVEKLLDFLTGRNVRQPEKVYEEAMAKVVEILTRRLDKQLARLDVRKDLDNVLLVHKKAEVEGLRAQVEIMMQQRQMERSPRKASMISKGVSEPLEGLDEVELSSGDEPEEGTDRDFETELAKDREWNTGLVRDAEERGHLVDVLAALSGESVGGKTGLGTALGEFSGKRGGSVEPLTKAEREGLRGLTKGYSECVEAFEARVTQVREEAKVLGQPSKESVEGLNAAWQKLRESHLKVKEAMNPLVGRGLNGRLKDEGVARTASMVERVQDMFGVYGQSPLTGDHPGLEGFAKQARGLQEALVGVVGKSLEDRKTPKSPPEFQESPESPESPESLESPAMVEADALGDLKELLEGSRHGQWVKDGKAQNGDTPRWKTTDKPGNPLGAGGGNPPKGFPDWRIEQYAKEGFLVDITKVTDPKDLPEAIRKTTRDSVGKAFEAVESLRGSGVDVGRLVRDWKYVEGEFKTDKEGGGSLKLFLRKYPGLAEGGKAIHDKWVENNAGLGKDDPLRQPFSKLAPSEQKKDLDFVIDAIRLVLDREKSVEKSAGKSKADPSTGIER